MNNRLIACVIACVVALLLVGAVNATQVTMNVDSKHIIGMGSGNKPFPPEKSINVVYVISERDHSGYDQYIRQEYPVSIQDYYKVQIGQKVTLEIPDNRLEECKVVNIE